MKIEFSRQILEKNSQISNSMNIPSAGAELLNADGRTDMNGEIDSRFSKFWGTRLKVLRQASLFYNIFTKYVSKSVCNSVKKQLHNFNPLNPELNPICYLLALLANHFLHVSRIMVKSLTLRLLMSYIYIHDISSLRVKNFFFDVQSGLCQEMG